MVSVVLLVLISASESVGGGGDGVCVCSGNGVETVLPRSLFFSQPFPLRSCFFSCFVFFVADLDTSFLCCRFFFSFFFLLSVLPFLSAVFCFCRCRCWDISSSKVRAEFRKILMHMGFEEMPTNRWVESSFWNFDSLFQPQVCDLLTFIDRFTHSGCCVTHHDLPLFTSIHNSVHLCSNPFTISLTFIYVNASLSTTSLTFINVSLSQFVFIRLFIPLRPLLFTIYRNFLIHQFTGLR